MDILTLSRLVVGDLRRRIKEGDSGEKTKVERIFKMSENRC